MYEHNNITTKIVEEALESIFKSTIEPTRRIVVRTGVGGADKFDEAIENRVGLKRIMIGRKAPRIIRRLNFKIKKSRLGTYYKLVKI